MKQQEKRAIIQLFKSQQIKSVNLGFEILLSFGMSHWKAFWFYMKNVSPTVIARGPDAWRATLVVPLANDFACRAYLNTCRGLPFRHMLKVKIRCVEDFREYLMINQ